MSISPTRLWSTIGSEEALAEMSETACWFALREESLGRIAIAPAGIVDIFPVNYVIGHGAVYFRTAPGDKLLGLAVRPDVAFEIDGHDEEAAFSVVLKGVAERVELQPEIDAAEELPLQPWLPTPKYRWVRIMPREVTGRVFLRGPEPERFA